MLKKNIWWKVVKNIVSIISTQVRSTLSTNFVAVAQSLRGKCKFLYLWLESRFNFAVNSICVELTENVSYYYCILCVVFKLWHCKALWILGLKIFHLKISTFTVIRSSVYHTKYAGNLMVTSTFLFVLTFQYSLHIYIMTSGRPRHHPRYFGVFINPVDSWIFLW